MCVLWLRMCARDGLWTRYIHICFKWMIIAHMFECYGIITPSQAITRRTGAIECIYTHSPTQPQLYTFEAYGCFALYALLLYAKALGKPLIQIIARKPQKRNIDLMYCLWVDASKFRAGAGLAFRRFKRLTSCDHILYVGMSVKMQFRQTVFDVVSLHTHTRARAR